MPMVDEFVNDDPANRLNDEFEKQIESTLLKQGQDYSARNARSKSENKGRAESRAKIKEIGMNPSAFAQAVKLIKDLTPAELKDWRRDFDLTLKIMGSKQRELFPEEQLKAEKRAQRQADEKAGKPRTKAELDAKTDTDPASDPANGGAQVDIEQAIAEATARELAEGAALLEGKSDAWRDGFNAFGAGAKPSDNPNDVVTSTERADWDAGYAAASERAFEAAKPAVATAPAPVNAAPGATFNDGVGKAAKASKAPKPSQSAKGNAIKDKAGLH